ncbi:MAG: FxLYD domain-containing protein [Variovorax sp.]
MARIARLFTAAACLLTPFAAVLSQGLPVVNIDRLTNVEGRVYPISLIKGRATNTGLVEAADVFIRFNTYDERAVLVETGTAHVRSLGPGAVANFETVLSKRFAAFQLVDVKAYFKRRDGGMGGMSKGHRETAL